MAPCLSITVPWLFLSRYDLASRGGAQTPIGKRTIAGKIVKDSYGAAKQQHTFTVRRFSAFILKMLVNKHHS